MAERGLLFTLRKHRKKSLFGAALFFYGLRYASQRYREYLIRREYFTEAEKYGDRIISPLHKPRRLYVILNPTASNGQCKVLFQKNVAPILTLAGIDVTFIQTDYEGHAKTVVNYFDSNIDGVVVAGGDGVLHEVVTGMFRQHEDEKVHTLPVGFIPLGTNGNYMYRKLFSSDSNQVRSICKATMAIVKGSSKETSILEIETNQKPLYALSNIHCGVHQQVKEKIDAGKYWILGPLKTYFAFIWRTARQWPPSFGINLSCQTMQSQEASKPALEQITEESNSDIPEDIHTDNFSLYLNEQDGSNTHLVLQKIQNDIPRMEFIKFGWDWMKNKFDFTSNDQFETLNCSEVSIKPMVEGNSSYDIDGEIFDARPITVRVHPRKLNMFCHTDT